jgi:hypothetical protein
MVLYENKDYHGRVRLQNVVSTTSNSTGTKYASTGEDKQIGQLPLMYNIRVIYLLLCVCSFEDIIQTSLLTQCIAFNI